MKRKKRRKRNVVVESITGFEDLFEIVIATGKRLEAKTHKILPAVDVFSSFLAYRVKDYLDPEIRFRDLETSIASFMSQYVVEIRPILYQYSIDDISLENTIMTLIYKYSSIDEYGFIDVRFKNKRSIRLDIIDSDMEGGCTAILMLITMMSELLVHKVKSFSMSHLTRLCFLINDLDAEMYNAMDAYYLDDKVLLSTKLPLISYNGKISNAILQSIPGSTIHLLLQKKKFDDVFDLLTWVMKDFMKKWINIYFKIHFNLESSNYRKRLFKNYVNKISDILSKACISAYQKVRLFWDEDSKNIKDKDDYGIVFTHIFVPGLLPVMFGIIDNLHLSGLSSVHSAIKNKENYEKAIQNIKPFFFYYEAAFKLMYLLTFGKVNNIIASYANQEVTDGKT